MSEELKRNLDSVHDELARQPELDPQTVESLRKLLSEISTAIERSGTQKSAESAAISDDFAGQVESLVTRFEAQHPQLSATLSKIANALASMGI